MEEHFSSVKSETASTKIMEQITQLIKSAKLKPGQKLPSEKDLAQNIGTSRATVREALSGLKALNLIESYPGKGNFVASDTENLYDLNNLTREIKTRASFIEALEARRAIEGEICQLAAKRHDSQLKEQMRKALSAGEVNKAEKFKQADFEFHYTLAKSSSNSLFIQFIKEAFLKLNKPYWNMLKESIIEHENIVNKEDIFADYRQDHRKIYEAIIARDGALARERMISHLSRIEENFYSYHEVAHG